MCFITLPSSDLLLAVTMLKVDICIPPWSVKCCNWQSIVTPKTKQKDLVEGNSFVHSKLEGQLVQDTGLNLASCSPPRDHNCWCQLEVMWRTIRRKIRSLLFLLPGDDGGADGDPTSETSHRDVINTLPKRYHQDSKRKMQMCCEQNKFSIYGVNISWNAWNDNEICK